MASLPELRHGLLRERPWALLSNQLQEMGTLICLAPPSSGQERPQHVQGQGVGECMIQIYFSRWVRPRRGLSGRMAIVETTWNPCLGHFFKKLYLEYLHNNALKTISGKKVATRMEVLIKGQEKKPKLPRRHQSPHPDATTSRATQASHASALRHLTQETGTRTSPSWSCWRMRCV